MSQVQQLMEMGIDSSVAQIALERNDYNLEKALEYIFSHPDIGEEEEIREAPVLPSRQPSNEITEPEYSRQVVPYVEREFQHQEFQEQEYITEASPRELTQTPQTEVIPILLPSDCAIDIAPLLTILHGITQARDALLMDTKDKYEFNPAWYTNASATNTDTSLVAETQKLMAFLDGDTKRAFNTISSLVACIPGSIASQLSGSSRTSDDSTAIGAFLEQLLHQHSGAAPTFRMVATDGHETEPMYNILLTVGEPSNNCTDIFEALDNLLWNGIREGSSVDQVAYLETIPAVITITCRREDAQSGAGVAVRPSFYPFRYSEDNIDTVTAVHKRAFEAKKESQSLFQKRFEMSNFQGHSVTKLLEVVVRHFDEEQREGVPELKTLHRQYLEARENIGDRIDQLEEMMDDVTVPTYGPEYLLKGAIISPSEFYTNRNGQWLHVVYIDETPAYRIEPVCEEEVCLHACRGSDQFDAQEVTLVYASTENSDMPCLELPESLRKFIDQDRLYFEAEQDSSTGSSSDIANLIDLDQMEESSFDTDLDKDKEEKKDDSNDTKEAQPEGGLI